MALVFVALPAPALLDATIDATLARRHRHRRHLRVARRSRSCRRRLRLSPAPTTSPSARERSPGPRRVSDDHPWLLLSGARWLSRILRQGPRRRTSDRRGDPWHRLRVPVAGVLLYGLIGWLARSLAGAPRSWWRSGSLARSSLGMSHLDRFRALEVRERRSAAKPDTAMTQTQMHDDTGDHVERHRSPLRVEGFTPPGPGDFNLPPIGPDKTFEFLGQTHVPRRHQADAPARPLGGRSSSSCFYARRVASARWSPAGCSSPARRPTASSATRSAATSSAAATS